MNAGLIPIPASRWLPRLLLAVLQITSYIICTFPTKSAEPSTVPSGVPHPVDTMMFTLAWRGGNCSGCVWIAAEGPITESTPQAFEAFLNSIGGDLDGRPIVRLNSDGGHLIAVLQLGAAIRSHKLATEVGRTAAFAGDPRVQTKEVGGCYSACAYAFLGGVKRKANTGELGFHQFYAKTSVREAIKEGDLDATLASAQRLMGLLVIYLKEMSINSTLLFAASSTDPDALFQPDAQSMFKMGITNVLVNRAFGGWTIEPYRTGAVVTGKLFSSFGEEGGFNGDQQITLFCRSNIPGKVLMLASWQYLSAAASKASGDNKSIRTNISGSSLAVGGKVIRQSAGYDNILDAHVDNNDRWFLTYVLTSDEFATGLKSGSIDIRVDGPHALGDFGFAFSPPTDGLGRAAQIAFRSCL